MCDVAGSLILGVCGTGSAPSLLVSLRSIQCDRCVAVYPTPRLLRALCCAALPWAQLTGCSQYQGCTARRVAACLATDARRWLHL